MKKILLWGYYFEDKWKDANWPLGDLLCPNDVQCILTYNESEYDTSDAVILHGRGTPLHGLPPAAHRPSIQVWVYATQESPIHAGHFYRDRNIINLTMTYLEKSDVLLMYGDIEPGSYMGGFNGSRNYLHGKSKTAAAIISNCKAKSRLKYVKALAKHIDIVIFGKCGTKLLCRGCWEQLRPYKFYLAFENTVCVDYVTEKFYDTGLGHGMVPVVLGGANYSNPLVAPPGSYINARNFASVKDLADFLKEVGSNSHQYNDYFNWLSSYRVRQRGYEEQMCSLCTLLHQSRTSKVYSDVVEWYKTTGHCGPYPPIS